MTSLSRSATLLFLIASLYSFCFVERIFAQIPSKGPEVLSLPSLRWGMSMKDLRTQLENEKKKFRIASDTIVVYEDALLDSPVKVSLTFSKRNEHLFYVTIEFKKLDRNLVESVKAKLEEFYGKPAQIEKKQESKLFITIDAEMRRWKLDVEDVFLATFFRGEQPMGIMLNYLSLVSKPIK